MIEKFPDKEWDFEEGISSNLSLKPKWIEKYSNKKWDWYVISANKNLSIKFIEKHIDKINFRCLSINTFNYFEKKIRIPKKIKLFYYLSFSKLPYDVRRFIVSNLL